MPNPSPTVVHAATSVSVDDVRAAFYRNAPQETWIREIHTEPLRLIVANDSDGTVARVDVTIDSDGTVSFGHAVPVRVEYVEATTGAADESRMVYASRAESRPESDHVAAHLSGRHNQKTHGRRYNVPGDPSSGLRYDIPGGTGSGTDGGGGGGSAVGGGGGGRAAGGGSAADAAIRNAYDALLRGEGTAIEPDNLDELLRTLTGGGDEAKRANLASLNVNGFGTLFATDKESSLDRSQMPQLGTNEEEMRPFLNLLEENGVDVSVGEIDPTTLKPSQSEISGAKTGKLYGFMAKDGWLPGGRLVTSNDGYVVDGHHRWSGAAAVRASGARPDMTVTGLMVDRPIDEVLQLAASVADYESLDVDRTAQASAASTGLAGHVKQLEEQVRTLSAQVAADNQERAEQVKASVLDQAQVEGKFTSADRSRWETDYDQAPEIVTRVLASIAPGTAPDEPGDDGDLEPEPEPDWLFQGN